MMSKLSGGKTPEVEHANESQANGDASACCLVKHQKHFQSQADWLINKGNPSPVSRYVPAFQTHKLKMLRYEYLIHTFITVI